MALKMFILIILKSKGFLCQLHNAKFIDLKIYCQLYPIMFREIITPKTSVVTVRFPEEMVGKTIEVIAFEISEGKIVPTRAQRLKQIENLTKSSLVDLSGFKFEQGRG